MADINNRESTEMMEMMEAAYPFYLQEVNSKIIKLLWALAINMT